MLSITKNTQTSKTLVRFMLYCSRAPAMCASLLQETAPEGEE